MSWANGRQLATYTNTTKSQNISYKYNEDSIRTEKTINGMTTKYFLEGSSIIFEDRNNVLISYLYDASGITGFIYNNSAYFYIKNLQGDIIAISHSV